MAARSTRTLALASAGTLCVSLAMALAAAPAHAASFTLAVTEAGNDNNSCFVTSPCRTIQRAVTAAGGLQGSADLEITIKVGAGSFAEKAGTSGAVVSIGSAAVKSLTIRGEGAAATIVKPTDARRVFAITGNFPVWLQGLTITGGRAALPTSATPGSVGADGGGILRGAGAGALELQNVVISDNRSGDGLTGDAGDNGSAGNQGGGNGAAGVAGTSGGSGGRGGGIAFTGTGPLTITTSTITTNRAGDGGIGGRGGNGGAGDSDLGGGGNGGNGGTGGNGGAGGDGGGIAFGGSVLTVTNSTIVLNAGGRGLTGGVGGSGGASGNGTIGDNGTAGAGGSAGSGGNGGAGGGIALSGPATATLTHVTMAANETRAGSGSGVQPLSGGIARAAASTVAVNNSVLANQPANCAANAGVTALFSVATEDLCFAAAGGNRVSDTAGKLGAPAANGGPTPTSALLTGNLAVDAVPSASCAATDQRGLPRPGLAGPDFCAAGAFEPQKPPPAPVAPTITGAVSSATGQTKFGWFRSTVTVTFTCTPGSSALVAPCPAPLVIANSGANQGGTVTIRNGEGLTAGLRIGVNVDKIDPKIKIKGAKNGKIYDGQRPLRCKATDTLSGVFDCGITVKAKLVKKGQLVQVKYKATAVDKAGNVETKKGKYFYTR